MSIDNKTNFPPVYVIGNKRFENVKEPARLENITLGGLIIGFQRTVRVPRNILNDLPANLGNFPIYRVNDFASKVPQEWNREGFFMPMYSQEALWLNFRKNYDPCALIVAAGNINAVTGRPFQIKDKAINVGLEEGNYMVVPPQPWLDGWKDRDGRVYQFVAAQLGSGKTVEGQLTGKEDIGGIQLIAYQPKPSAHERLYPRYFKEDALEGCGCLGGSFLGDDDEPLGKREVKSMGLGRGGEIKQKIYPDPHGIDVWDPSSVQTTTIYLVDSRDFPKITGQQAPPTPITIETYRSLGYPWFGLADGSWNDTKGSAVFGELKPVDE